MSWLLCFLVACFWAFICLVLLVDFLFDIFLLVIFWLLCSFDDLCSRAFICLVFFGIGFPCCLLLTLYFLWMGYIYIHGIFFPCGWICFKKWLKTLPLSSKFEKSFFQVCTEEWYVMVKKLVMASCHIITKTLDGRKCGIFYAYIESRKHNISIENTSFQITLLLVIII
jgi:hypothetical protein